MQYDTVEEIGLLLNRTLRRHEAELGLLGEKVRVELVEPACKKHKLAFVSGNGTFFFQRRATKNKGFDGFDAAEPKYGSREDFKLPVPYGYRGLSDAAKRTLGPLLDLLNEEISHGQYLGYLVADVE